MNDDNTMIRDHKRTNERKMKDIQRRNERTRKSDNQTGMIFNKLGRDIAAKYKD